MLVGKVCINNVVNVSLCCTLVVPLLVECRSVECTMVVTSVVAAGIRFGDDGAVKG